MGAPGNLYTHSSYPFSAHRRKLFGGVQYATTGLFLQHFCHNHSGGDKNYMII
jgi:hypothetical protein